MSHARYTLRHTSIQQFLVKGSAGVLVSTITVEQQVRIWIFLNDLVKDVKDQFVVISVTNTATACIAL